MHSLTVTSVAAAHVCLCVLVLKDIIIALMNKLAQYAHESPSAIPAELEMFPLFHKYTSKIIQQSSKLSLADQLQLQVALLNFSTKVYPDRVDYVDNVLGFSVEIMQKAGGSVDHKAVKLVTELLSLPMEALLLRILQLNNFAPLLAFLELQNRRDVAAAIMNAIVKVTPSAPPLRPALPGPFSFAPALISLSLPLSLRLLCVGACPSGYCGEGGCSAALHHTGHQG